MLGDPCLLGNNAVVFVVAIGPQIEGSSNGNPERHAIKTWSLKSVFCECELSECFENVKYLRVVVRNRFELLRVLYHVSNLLNVAFVFQRIWNRLEEFDTHEEPDT